MPTHAAQPARILSIEDDAAIGQFLQAVLSANGYTVDLAIDGKEGLASVRARRPDVIILDLLMPYKSGFEVLRELKDAPATSGIPIIILSSNSREEDIVHALDAGADDFIIKPFRARELLARVRKLLGPSRDGPPKFTVIPGGMADFVSIIIDIVGTLFILVLSFILLHKLVVQIRAGYERRHRAMFVPWIQAYIAADHGTFREFVPVPIRGWDRRVVLWLMFDRIRLVKGRAQQRLSDAFEELGFVDIELAKLKERRWSRRVEGAEHLGWMMSRRSLQQLAALMQDPVPEVRIRAAKALGAIGGMEAVESLLGALRDTNRWSALRIADILSGLGQAAVEPLLREFAHLPPPARVPAIDILGRLRSHLSVPLLRALLRDPEPNARARAAHSLGLIGDPRATDDLVTALQDEAWPVRAMAAKALGLVSGTQGIPALQRALGDREWWVRSNAAEALRAKGPPGHLALISMLDGKDAYAAQKAAWMLQEAGVFDDYLARLVGGTPAERVEAESLFAKLVALRRLDLLNDIASRHGDPAVQAEVRRLLAAAQPGSGAA